jgi:hypothetical protein
VVDSSARVETKTWGEHLVWGRLWEETLSPVLAEALFPERLARAVYLMVLGRLSSPQSKAMPAFHAVGMRAPRRLERLD